ncbi:MAG: hypothetical protein ACE3JP_14575 [Ectobacillus sp.]
MQRKIPVRVLVAFALFGMFLNIIFYTGQASNPKAFSDQQQSTPVSYQIVYEQQTHVPISASSNKDKLLLKGMIVTHLSTRAELTEIAKQIKEKYAHRQLDSIELTVHDKNNGLYEGDYIPYKPISKGTISITYTSLGHKELKMPKNETILVRINK